jgi:hypothetical protein
MPVQLQMDKLVFERPGRGKGKKVPVAAATADGEADSG